MPAPNQPNQSQQFAMQTPCTMMFVNSYEEIEGMWIPNGYTTFFFNFNAMELYIRKKEPNGMIGPVRVIEMRDKIPQQQLPQTDTVTRAEFDEFKATLLSAINNAQANHENEPEREERPYKPRSKNGGRRS
jgi:hypothetical protein